MTDKPTKKFGAHEVALIVFGALVLTVVGVYAYSSSKEANDAYSNSDKSSESTVELSDKEVAETKEQSKEVVEEVKNNPEKEGEIVTAQGEEKPEEFIENPKPSSLGFTSVGATASGSSVSVTATLPIAESGTCSIKLINGEEKVFKEFNISNQTTCFKTISGLASGTWKYSVLFVSSDKTKDAASGVMEITVN